MVRWMVTMLVIAGCNDEDKADDAASCVDGFTAGADGLCYQDTDSDSDSDSGDTGAADSAADAFEALLEDQEPCELLPAEDILDLDAGCFEGACAGMTFEEMSAVLGDAVDCTLYTLKFGSYESRNLQCTWYLSGTTAGFPDQDGDAKADPGAGSYNLALSLLSEGASPDGLGVGAAMRCYADVLGPPLSYAAEQDGDRFSITTLGYAWGSVSDDYDNKDAIYGEIDGLADGMSLTGP